MFQRFCLVCVFLMLSLPLAVADSFRETRPERVGISSERLARVDNTVQGFIDRDEIAGAVTLIARRGKIAHFKAYGWRDLETKDPMERDCLFRLFSMTKPITCTALMILVEEGKILLTDPVSQYLPEFSDMKVLIKEKDNEIITAPANSPITIQQLAMHTSGIGYGIPRDLSPTLAEKFDLAEAFAPSNPLKDAIRTLASFPLLHQPGQKWQYGASIDVLARVIEVVTEKPYETFLQERLFTPLKMRDAGFHTPETDWDRVASLYTQEDGRLKRTFEHEDYYKIGVHHGGGSGLMATMMDYARFAQMLCNGGELEGVRVLSPQSIERMSTNLLRDEVNNTPWHNDRALGFGLGVSVVKDPATLNTLSSVGTWGWSGYASTEFFIDPQKEIVSIFMAQFVPTNTKQWWQKYTNTVYQSMIE